jgi:density-regulated protein DRP1
VLSAACNARLSDKAAAVSASATAKAAAVSDGSSENNVDGQSSTGSAAVAGGEVAAVVVEEEKKKKVKGPKKVEVRVVIAKIQRQKRKYVTAVAGLESVPELRIKDAAKSFGKKFSSGCSVQETASGAKEVVIQGDVCFELPQILISEFKVPAECIFFLEDGSLRPFA